MKQPMKRARLQIERFTVSQIQGFLAERKLAIPELQREFVWNQRKAAALLDSIWKRLPIGTIMIWETHKRNRHLLREKFHILPDFDTHNRNIWFLLDGQQRISVLHQARQGSVITTSEGKQIDFGRLCFSFESRNDENRFVFRKRVSPKYVRMRDVLAPDWRGHLKNLPKGKFNRAKKCRQRILKYQVPVVFVRTGKVDEVREAFIRINSLGTPVSAADRAFARASTVKLRHFVRQAKHRLAEGFQDLPDNTVLLTMAFMRGERKDVGERPINAAIEKLERRVNARESTAKKFSKEWLRLAKALGKAVDYLRHNFGVLNRGFLPSDNMVATLTMFFYWNRGQPNAMQKRAIRKWFWATGVAQRYSGRGYRQNILSDLRFFERLVEKGNARLSFPGKVFKSDIRHAEFTRRAGLTNAFFCLLLKQKPRYIENGDPIPLMDISARANSGQKHHIFPKRRLSRRGFQPREYNSLCNICFIVAEENQSIGNRAPNDYLDEAWEYYHFYRVMRSHLIPADDDSGVWDEDIRRGYRKFVKQRLEMICQAFEKAAGTKLFQEG